MFTIKTKSSKTYDVTADVAVMAGDGQMSIVRFTSEGFTTANVAKVKRIIKATYVDDGWDVLGISNINIIPIEGSETVYKFDISRDDIIRMLINADVEYVTE